MTLRRVSTGVTYTDFSTALAAVATLTADEVIEDIDGGSYTEAPFTSTFSGAFTLTIRAATTTRPELIRTGTQDWLVQCSSGAKVVIEDWDLRKTDSGGGNLVRANSVGADLTLRRCRLIGSGSFAGASVVSGAVATNLTLENCLISNVATSTSSGSTLALLSNVASATFRYCTFVHTQTTFRSCVYSLNHTAGDTLRVEGCVFRYAATNANVGILYFAATADLDTYVGNGNVFSKTASQNTAYVASPAASHADLAAWRTASGDDADSVAADGAVPLTTLFVDESNRNYDLVTGSAASLAALASITTLATDLLGRSRPQGSAYDAGAYEALVVDAWARNLARRETSWCVLVRIEGVGDRNGQWSFSNAIPAHLDSGTAKPWLTALPELLSERVDLAGGIPEANSCTVELLDYSDTLTSLWRTDRAPRTVLEEDVDAAETSIDVLDADNLANEVVWVGSEAMLVTADASSPERITVTRGWLGTDALTHKDGDLVYLSTPYLEGRRVEVYLCPLDSTSSADERLIGSYVLESVSLDDGANAWRLSCTGQHRYLDRRLPIVSRRGRAFYADATRLQLNPGPVRALWSDQLAYMRVGDEVIEVYDPVPGWLTVTSQSVSLPLSTVFALRSRALFGTNRGTIEVPADVHQVFLAGRDLRYSPGPSPSTSRSSGTWTPAEHWVDLMLILLLSSASADDGLELVNRRTTGSDWSRSNFSALPPGMGAGIPQDLIDWASFEAIRARTLSWRLPFFVYGDKPDLTAAEVLSTQFLRPFGAFLSYELGMLRLGISRPPLFDQSTALQITADNVLRRETAPGVYLPEVSVSRERARAVGAVTYKVGPGAVSATYRSSDFAGTYGQRGWYGMVEPSITIEVPGGDPANAAFFASRAAARLWRLHKPPMALQATLDVAAWPDTSVGSFGEVTLAELPDDGTGTRGWTDVAVELEERVVRLQQTPTRNGGAAVGASVQVRARRYSANLRLGRIAQAARVSSVAGNAATVLANRYTHADADDQDYADVDAEAFAVGDAVWLTNPDGSRVGSTTQTVSSVSGNVITLNGNFAGALAADLILITAGVDDAVAEQKRRYAFMCDENGAGADRIFWRWGEP
jgi:hypothetical protein